MSDRPQITLRFTPACRGEVTFGVMPTHSAFEGGAGEDDFFYFDANTDSAKGRFSRSSLHDLDGFMTANHAHAVEVLSSNHPRLFPVGQGYVLRQGKLHPANPELHYVPPAPEQDAAIPFVDVPGVAFII